MNARFRNAGVAVAGAAVLASGAYALGTQAGNGSASARSEVVQATPVNYGTGDRFGPRRFHDRAQFGLDALAQKLGVTPAALRSALADIRQSLPAKDDLATKLADALGLPADKVTAALQQLRPERSDPAAALAKALGLDTAKVQAAFDKLRSQFRPGPGARADFFAALANELGVSPAKLRSAIRSLRPDMPPHERGDRLAALANALGVTPDKLQAAFDKIRSDMRDAFVTALADRLHLDRSKVESALGSFPGPGPFFGRRHHP